MAVMNIKFLKENLLFLPQSSESPNFPNLIFFFLIDLIIGGQLTICTGYIKNIIYSPLSDTKACGHGGEFNKQLFEEDEENNNLSN